MKKINFLLFLAIFLLGISSVYAQLNDASVSGPPVKGTNVQPTEVHSLPIPMDQRVPHINTPMQGHEYGSFNYNAFCGTGTAGGYVAAPSSYNENVDGAIECWIYPTSTASSVPAIVAKGDAINVSFFFGWSSSTGLLGLRFGSTYTANTGGTVVPLNQWTHVAVSWTGAPGAYTFTFFVNGAISGATAANAGTWAVNSDSLTIGSSRAAFGGKDFIGNIDEVKIWYSTRTAADFAANRFVGLGDGGSANASGALTSAASYTNLMSSYTFNSGGNAYDDISGYTGFYRNGSGPYYAFLESNPIPYNFVLQRPAASITSYVTVPHNTAFNQNGDGTLEMWFKTTDTTTTQWLINKGSSSNISFGFGMASNDLLVLRFGNTAVTNTGGIHIPINKWTHIAASWTGTSGNYTAKFYVNGVQSGPDASVAGTWNLTTDPLTLGISIAYSGFGLLGYMDEVRYWSVQRTPAQIKNYMFASCRGFATEATLIGAWNFDGNLLNFSSTADINGSFNTGGTNNCRLSGYANENLAGAPANTFVAHPTVINRGGTPNSFPVGFNIKLSNKAILDNATTLDTFTAYSSRVITSVELFLAVQHTYVGDLTITLTAPNGTSKSVLASSTGGTGEGILTFFIDGQPLPSTAGFFAPWSPNCGPAAAFGNFGGANMLGRWILSVADGVGGDQGMIQGWGLRFNGDNVIGITPISNNIPIKFELFQNYPNPFNPVTKISYAIPVKGLVTLKVYDITGKEVASLVNEVNAAGNYNVDFNGANLSSGVYFYKLVAGTLSEVKKMMIVK
ncbi:MAG TPA: LamG-like jellyroll fold domain-containing protein [Ignavibacteria bacterium]